MLQAVFEAVIPGGKLQAPVASRTCWANWQGVLLVDPVVPPLPPVVVVVGAFGAQEFPFQNVFGPQPPGGGVGPVGVVVVGAQKVPFQEVFGPQPPGGGLGAVGVVEGAQKVPFQAVFGPQPPGGGVGGVGAGGVGAGGVGAGGVGAGGVGAGPPFFSQEAWVVPSLQRTAWALGAPKPIKPASTSESARSSDEAALKRFITSSKARYLG